VRFLTFNVQGFDAGIDRVAAVIGAADPDVVALQEARRGAAAELRRRLGYHLAFAAPRPFRDLGNAILAREPIQEWWKVRLSKARGLVRRGAVAAALPSGVEVISVHFGLSGAERERHAGELLRATSRDEMPLIIGCDLNEGPGAAAYEAISSRLTDVFGTVGKGSGETFPATAPRKRIDVVFCSPTLTPRAAAVVPIVGSDHLAVIADIG
jgi:endonuclease/exonuclease/phosphatase family metal-dependent hydrolase